MFLGRYCICLMFKHGRSDHLLKIAGWDCIPQDGSASYLKRKPRKPHFSTIDIYWYMLISIDVYWCLLYWYLLISIDICWYLLMSIDVYWCLLMSTLLISIDIYWYLLISTLYHIPMMLPQANTNSCGWETHFVASWLPIQNMDTDTAWYSCTSDASFV